MMRQVLARYGFPPADILRFSDAVHEEVYRPFRGTAPVGRGLQALADLRRAERSLEVEWLEVLETSSLVGRTIADVAFRTRTGASIVAVHHDGDVEPNPGADYRLRAGDLLGVLGTAEQRAAARDLIQEGESA
jgi:CPA2 family monovalent cation:H+ antiporter-2